MARWDSSTGYWEASAAPEGTASENETIATIVGPFNFADQDESATTWFSLSRRLRESDRGRLLLTDARLGSGSSAGRTPFVPVLADYLIDLPRTLWPGPNSDVGPGDAFVQLHGPVSGGRNASAAANWNLYYTGSVVTDLTVATNATSPILGLTSLTGISPGQVLYINDEAMQVLSVDPGTSTITVTRGYDGTTATSHSSGDYLQRDDGLGWFFANTHTAQNRIEDFRMTLLGGLINQETQPAFDRDILYEDASPRDTGRVREAG